MKTMRKSTALFLALIMCLAFFSFGTLASNEDMSGQIVILHTNDVHSRIAAAESPGFAGVAAAKAYYESLGAYVLLFDAGDMLHGMPIANLSKGSFIVELMNAVGYDAMAPGNHDFNYTAPRLLELAEEMNFPVLSSNYTDDDTGLSVFEPYAVFDAEDLGIKIGVVGITTPEAATKSSPLNTIGYSFSGDNLYEVVQAQIDELIALDCDYIIALGHLGIDSESVPWRSVDVIEATTGINLLIDGHSHSTLQGIENAGFSTVSDKDGNDVVIASTGRYLENIGIVTIVDGVITAGYVEEELEPDADVAAMIDEINEELKPLLEQVVASTLVELTAARAPGNRTEETNLGNLCTDAFRYVTGADVALTNGGGIRDTSGAVLPVGDITYETLNGVYPFGNELVTINISGADLLAALEHGTAAAPGPSGGFPQVSGVTFEVHLYETENRVKNVMVGDEPLDLNAVYSLATNDFTQIGGDGYTMLAEYGVTAYYNALDEALVQYVVEMLDGKVGQEYANIEGRIVMVDMPAAWAVGEIGEAIDLGLVPFYMKWKYTEATTRAEFAELAVTLYELFTGKEIATATNPFNDTNNIYAIKAFTIGVTQGDGNAFTFNPDGTLTRQQAATMLARLAAALDMELPKEDMDFADSETVNSWAVEAVGQVQAAGIMGGVSGGRFSPMTSYERQQSIATILRLFNYANDNFDGVVEDVDDVEDVEDDVEEIDEEAEDEAEEVEDIEDEEEEDLEPAA
ncbi:MAG: bifunctional metallophosphatase/5'-nucleotidase [Oscillospiraceae bacterium]|nr:bifunctional metallophosphatase/5'-nucleotidase [Oscillospiraceae bacterium]